MKFPAELYDANDDLEKAEHAVMLFTADPIIMTDSLANSIYFSEEAERLFTERGEALVNRSVFSLLGFESFAGMPASLINALSGDGDAWRGFVKHPAGDDQICFVEISCIRGAKFTTGLIRYDVTKIRKKAASSS